MSINVVIAWPSLGTPKNDFAFSLARLVAYFAQVRVFPEVAEQAVDVMTIEGSGISSQREDLCRDALAKPDMTHLLWIDEDMGFTPDCLHILARRRQPIVGANYRMRVPPADFTALKLDKSERIQTTDGVSGLEEAYYTGFGFCLIERKVLEAVPQPRFPIWYNPDTGRYTTEDHPFFVAAREKGFPCYVDHDASKRVWHKGGMSYCWNEDYSALGKNFVKANHHGE